jgi:hypothetical protein
MLAASLIVASAAHLHATHWQLSFVMSCPYLLPVLFAVPLERVVSRIQKSGLWLATPWLPMALLGAWAAPEPLGPDFVFARTAEPSSSCCSGLTRHRHDRIAFVIVSTMM